MLSKHLIASDEFELFYLIELTKQKIKPLLQGHHKAGHGKVIWDGKNDMGIELSSGFYFYRLQTPSGTQIKKMLFIK
jgi:hypothetical protein